MEPAHGGSDGTGGVKIHNWWPECEEESNEDLCSPP